MIANPQNTVFLSAVSFWEIHLKQSVGKLRLPADFDTRIKLEGFENLPLTERHTRLIADLPWASS
jgi:PIN domain nuclease of toxin-antitoxin system